MSLKGKIALITGASRGAGRGIAIELAQQGVKVYITSRSRRGKVETTQHKKLTLDDTVDIITSMGGQAFPITCDHTQESEITAIFNQINRDEGKLDILVNNVWGGYMGEYGNLDIETASFSAPFWEQPVWRYDKMFNTSLRAHFIASQLAAPIMIAQKEGLIVTTSFWDQDKYISNLPYDLVKMAKKRLSFGMAIELQAHNITALTIGLGWIRTEHLKNVNNLNDENYIHREEFEFTESTRYVGRAIVALAIDPERIKHTGKVLTTSELAQLYQFTDLDGTQPEYFSIPDKSNGITQR
ncbi:SDR family NAD(P)-dependent oxidoreductase [Candidatus Lokiarchaeum ossiferum]|uniref:SDR family NAD(P)-dependent oxidoreductase n=1 Tax=Candidatus Lokiarchaeum ossiferum TaxID=2951803 RepID=UPI00352FC019